MRSARAGIFAVLLFQGRDFVLAQEGEEFQVTNDIAVVGADPVLIELIDTGPARIEPDGAGFGLAKFSAIGIRNERQSQAINCAPEFFAGEIDAGSDAAPLIAAADLELTIPVAAKEIEIEGLQQQDRKSTRLNSSHTVISYAVFCLKKKKKIHKQQIT